MGVSLKGAKIIITSTGSEQLLVLVSELGRVNMHVGPVALDQIPILGDIYHRKPPVLMRLVSGLTVSVA